ncbi:MAG: helix-turn-helix domain-containing protein [Pseudomonadota bacterium]
MPSFSIRRAEDIAGLIKSRRKAIGLSQQALADILTVSRKWVNEIEKGNANAKLGLVLRALNELQIDITADCISSSAIPATDVTAEDEIDIDAIVDEPPPRSRR